MTSVSAAVKQAPILDKGLQKETNEEEVVGSGEGGWMEGLSAVPMFVII
jgi:hypothetical protein